MTTMTKASENGGGLASLLSENTEKILTCVHCGLCLPACPTYRELGNENDSPRGRVYLMRAVVESRLPVGGAFASHIDLCLGCRACEPVCPSGVPYGKLLEAARGEIVRSLRSKRSLREILTRLVLNQIFTRPALLSVGFRIARWVRDRGLGQLAFESKVVSGRFGFAMALLLASRASKRQPATTRSGQPLASVQAAGTTRVAALRGCVMEGLFARVNRATERVLAANGCELVDVKEQSCCGALHAHGGYEESARMLARRNIEAFLSAGCDRIVVNSAGCGAAMKEYREWFAGDPKLAERAREFSSKVRDVSELLAETGIEPPGHELHFTVAYDAPCHLIHAQRVAEAPISMLEAVPGLEVKTPPGYETCCGGAGIYNLQHPELSGDILRRKLDAIESSGVELVATGNPGCIMQIGAGLLVDGRQIDAVHPVELLDWSYLLATCQLKSPGEQIL